MTLFLVPWLGRNFFPDTRSFRQGIEDVLSLMDDVVLPAEYHSALLELTNAIFATLGQTSGRHQ